jgi:hypothetical protein
MRGCATPIVDAIYSEEWAWVFWPANCFRLELRGCENPKLHVESEVFASQKGIPYGQPK